MKNDDANLAVISTLLSSLLPHLLSTFPPVSTENVARPEKFPQIIRVTTSRAWKWLKLWWNSRCASVFFSLNNSLGKKSYLSHFQSKITAGICSIKIKCFFFDKKWKVSGNFLVDKSKRQRKTIKTPSSDSTWIMTPDREAQASMTRGNLVCKMNVGRRLPSDDICVWVHSGWKNNLRFNYWPDASYVLSGTRC